MREADTTIGHTQHGRIVKESPVINSPSKWQRVARLGWFIFLSAGLSIVIISLPAYLAGLENFDFTAASAVEPSTLDKILNVTGMAASLMAVVVSLGLAILLYWRKGHDWMALYLSFFLIAYGTVMAGPLEVAGARTPWLSGLALSYGQPILVASPFIILVCIFPNGKFLPVWTKWLAVVSVVSLPMLVSIPFYADPTNIEIQDWIFMGFWIVLILVALYSQFYRYRNISTPQERQQTRWAIFGFAMWISAIFILTIPYLSLVALPSGADVPAWAAPFSLFWWLSLLTMPVTLTIAVMRYRLWDLELVVNRTLVYGGLTAAVISIYILVVGALGTLFQAQGNIFVALLATGLVAVLFQPLRERLQREVNRLIYGERDDPVTVLTRLGKQLEMSVPQQAVLPMLVETVAETLKLPYVGILLATEGRLITAAEYGRSRSTPVEFSLVYRGENIGKLLVNHRSPGDPFNPAEIALLANVARQAGAAAHLVQLTTDLQRSRQRLVTAREEERRRLRRDLHDGLGPALAAHLLKIGAARSRLEEEPARAGLLLDQLEEDVETTLAEIRHLVYGLRPPELDQLGLLEAIHQYADRYSSGGNNKPDDDGLLITIETPAEFPLLMAAVEVAAYRIIQEGLKNVVTHSNARHCQVKISVNGDWLKLEIIDDGLGIAPDQASGVGLASMRERAEELGGAFQISGKPGFGTRVSAQLPLAILDTPGQDL